MDSEPHFPGERKAIRDKTERFFERKGVRRSPYWSWNPRQVRIRRGRRMTKGLRAGESSPGGRHARGDLSPGYLSMVARTPLARRLRTWTCQRLCGERSRPCRPGSRARTSSNRMLEQWEEHQPPIRSNTYFGVVVLSALATSSCARSREGRSAQERYSEVGRYPRRSWLFWNAKRRLRIRNCPR